MLGSVRLTQVLYFLNALQERRIFHFCFTSRARSMQIIFHSGFVPALGGSRLATPLSAGGLVHLPCPLVQAPSTTQAGRIWGLAHLPDSL